MLVACELGQEVELRVVGKSLVIEAVKTPRHQWFDGYQPEADIEPLATLPVDEDDAEWAW
jgi:antitoxin MazE